MKRSQISLLSKTAGLSVVVLTAMSVSILSAPAATHSRGESLSPHQDLLTTVRAQMDLADGRIISLDVDLTPEQPIRTAIEIDGEQLTLDLEPHSIRSPNYRLLADRGNGVLEEIVPGPVRTLRGSIMEIPGSNVVGNLLENGLEAIIRLPDEDERYVIEPIAGVVAEAEPGQHVMYRNGDVISDGGTCGVVDEIGAGNDADPADGEEPPAADGGGGVAGFEVCVYFSEIACAADWEYFDGPGNNNVLSVESRINGVVNGVGNQYLAEVQIELVLTTIIVHSDPDDPYSDTSVGGTLLNEFRDRWELVHDDIPRAQAELFTGRDISGTVIGIASSTQVCTDMAYSVVENINPAVCRNDLSAHELGHNWSALHCGCPGNTMNESLTCANNFTTANETRIKNYRDSRPCLEEICPPENDSCFELETVIPGVPVDFDLRFADDHGFDESLCGGDNDIDNDVWYVFTAPCTGPITVSVCDSDFDTRIALYNGPDCPTGPDESIACNDDGCGLQSSLTANLIEDEQYLIEVGGTSNNAGLGTMIISVDPGCISTPFNDVCSFASTLSEGTHAFSTLGANTEGFDEPICDFNGQSQIDNDIWFRHIAQCDGELTVSLCGSGYDSKLALYGASCPGGAGAALACNDDACGSQSEVTIPVTTSQLVRIRIGGFSGATGAGQITISCEEPGGCLGDTNDDNMVNVTDLLNVILDWDSDGSVNGGDVNTDGIVNVQDLLDVILAWGVCP